MKNFTIKLGIWIFLVGLLLASCTIQSSQRNLSDYFTNTDSGIQNGNVKMITITTPKGDFKVWTKRFGYNPTLKVLLLHGGPGATHEYFECFENFLPAEGIEFIYYNQLGSAYSDQPGDTSLWSLDRFVDEVEQVRKALNLNRENCIVLGHSWGGWLAIEYALKYQENLKGLILSNTMASSPDYDRYAKEVLAKQMDPGVLDTLRRLEAKGDYGNPKYMELLIPHYYQAHICRLPIEEWPEPFLRSFKKMNSEIYTIMQGPTEFGIGGKLKLWDRKSEIKKLTLPVLTIGAKHDTMDPDHLQWIADEVQSGSFLYCSRGSHMAMYDDQQTYFQGLIKFLKAVDKGDLVVGFESE
ncbi:MAG: proline iminopeptidase-family hydrolase [Marinifilaceae bacterium]